MKQKELRLALVCYGGISLAIYMHGITKEFQKLLRASKIYHKSAGQKESSYNDKNDDHYRETDTEVVYYEFLKHIGKVVNLRIIVDIIAGASAGGINGIFLARAIAEDLPLDPLREMWLINADVEKLLDMKAAPRSWSKFYIRPLLWLSERMQSQHVDEMIGRNSSLEMRMKLSKFLRSRWFEPPFSGSGFANILYQATLNMGPSGSKEALLPPGHPLDLFVTVTDYHGYAHTLKLHSPDKIREIEHRLVISFSDKGLQENKERQIGSVADLAFAARATASFPGMFPPATLAEMKAVAMKHNDDWESYHDFTNRTFSQLIEQGGNPIHSAFIDGSVLNNKPFREAIEALPQHTAYREVDRRIVYIEPNPRDAHEKTRQIIPGFFSTIRAALSDIPRNQPIHDDLEWLQYQSKHAQRINTIIENMRDDVTKAIDSKLGTHITLSAFTGLNLKEWRHLGHIEAAISSGFAYAPYVETKLYAVLDSLADYLSSQFHSKTSLGGVTVQDIIHDWAKENSVLPVGRINTFTLTSGTTPWIKFLGQMDRGFRIRRLRFLIRRVNTLYSQTRRIDQADADHSKELDSFKKIIYECLNLFIVNNADNKTQNSMNKANIDKAILDFCKQSNLIDADSMIDGKLAGALLEISRLDIRRDLLLSYVGFAFFDIATLPMQITPSNSSHHDHVIESLEEIKVDRISPEDAVAIRKGGAQSCLKGISFGSFGAFFSRAYRENDYLWGRLHAADRLVDLVISATPEIKTAINALSFKKQLFKSILASERAHLKNIDDVFASLEKEIDAIEA